MTSATNGSAKPGPDWMRLLARPVVKVAISTLLVTAATVALLWNTLFADMPRLPARDAFWNLKREAAVEFLDAKGQSLAVRGPHYGRAVTLDELPEHVVQALIAAEDKRFYTHEGVDNMAMLRAVLANFRSGSTVQGASTLTQQLIKNLFLSPEQSLKRKAQEARLAMDLERLFTKKEILELYINRVYLGEGAYGIDAAAHRYFNKSPKELTLAEAALIAALPKAPSRLGADPTNAAARGRRSYVLQQMVEAGFITNGEAEAARREAIVLAPEPPPPFSGHVLDWATEQARQLLPDAPPDLVVQLSIDLDLQKAAQEAVNRRIREMGPDKKASEGALVFLDHTGAVKAMVGGVNYARSQFNRAVQARRQPGSAFKMFVFAAALEDGLRPSTIRYDEPVRIGSWRPRNYGGDYRGAVTLSEALADSLNTVAAQVGVEIGTEKVVALARRFGVKSQLHTYPSITLGSDEVTLLDMTAAYGVLATGGLRTDAWVISEIRNTRGEVLYRRNSTDLPRVYQQQLAEDMTGMLNRVVVQGTGAAARVPGWDVAGKTGTSQDWRDAWFIGYTTRYVGGVWVGNDDDRPMQKVTGGELSAAIFADVMKTALAGIPPEPLPGARSIEEYLPPETLARLSFYRRLSSAFGSVSARRVASADTGTAP